MHIEWKTSAFYISEQRFCLLHTWIIHTPVAVYIGPATTPIGQFKRHYIIIK